MPAGISGNAVAIAAGAFHCLALKNDGTVAAWGLNDNSQSTVPGGLATVVAIAAGASHSLALKADGHVVAWGNNSFGQRDVPTDLDNVVGIYAGQDYSAAVKNDGSVRIWGNNAYTLSPAPAAAKHLLQDSSGPTAQHILAIRDDLALIPWGRNLEGQATPPADFGDVIAVAGSQSHSLALYVSDWDGDGMSGAWERQYFGNLDQNASGDYDGDGFSNLDEFLHNTDPTVANPPAIAVQPQSKTVFRGNDVTFTVAPSGSLTTGYTYQWCFNSRDIAGATDATLTLGQAQFTNSGVYYVRIGNTTGFVTSLLARLTVWTPGAVLGWGRNNDQQTNVPAGLTNIVGISGGNSQTLALRSDGTVMGWTVNHYGELSIPNTLNNVAVISAGGWHSMALTGAGNVVVWGDNYYGQCTVPAGVNGNAVAIAAGHNHCLALKKDGRVVAWGDNSQNQTTVPGNLENVVAIMAGSAHSLALKNNGTVVAWGATGPDNYGQQNVPGTLADVVSLCAGYHHSAAVKTDGSVVVWGDNTYGQKNLPGTINNNVVALVSGSSGSDHLLAIRNDLAVIGWGRYNYNQKDPPDNLDDTVAVAAGQDHSLALTVSDWDSDGLPGWWERLKFGNLDQDGNGDPDGDGLSNLDEFLGGSNPNVPNAPAIAVPPQSQTAFGGSDGI